MENIASLKHRIVKKTEHRPPLVFRAFASLFYIIRPRKFLQHFPKTKKFKTLFWNVKASFLTCSSFMSIGLNLKEKLVLFELSPSPSFILQKIKTLPMRCCRIYKQGEEASFRCGPVRQCLPLPSAGSRCTRDLDVEIQWIRQVHDPHLSFPLTWNLSTPPLQTVGTCFLAGSIVQRSPSQSVPGIQHCCHVVALQLHIRFCTLGCSKKLLLF